MRNYFPKRLSGVSLQTLSNYVPVSFVTPPPCFEVVYCFICGRRRVAVARYWMICLLLSIAKHIKCIYSEFDIMTYRYKYQNIPLFSNLAHHTDSKYIVSKISDDGIT